MSRELDWDHQRAFLAVLDSGSLSGAARALGLTQPTVRRRIETLEQRLGTVLFTRAPTGLLPTESALMMAEPARAMAHAAEAFVRIASAPADALAGVVRVSASDIIAIEVLPPILAALKRRHPGLVITLSPSNRVEDVLRRESDIAVRMVPPAQDALVARRIGAVPLALHAHRDYLAEAGTPASLADLARHCLIGTEHDTAMLRELRARGYPLDVADFGFRSDDDLAHMAAIRAGIGIGVCQIPLAMRDPALVHVLPEAFRFDLETWLVMHEDLRRIARVRVVFDAVAAGLGAYLGRQASAAASIAEAAPGSA
ncbi:LysR family transcriptional regulator [Hephaestia mangrovi]|uniref:LysR family transcriptional regulator n=1 Tax=Hephaestia mangrovi TaxID=2873268 RepID=UPI001CA76D4B|nr:LysR family transcriptional regulator [Hephaestia mangrovi]MBY8829073.1 LysR family transcriptional regulator [Hephaestia mangrovi]